MAEFWQEIASYGANIDFLEFAGAVFGLLTVWFLIKENILTWPAGITYVLISFVIFYRIRLYADLALHFFFLVLNIYGWYYWTNGKQKAENELAVTSISIKFLASLSLLSLAGIYIMGTLFKNYTDAAIPYWDSATTTLSLTAMWLTARKKIENWYFWIVVDILATGIYVYKGIYFYAALYGIYIFMAFFGLISWKKSMLAYQDSRT